jgi:autotransporter-associated beta strand protein
MKPLILSLIFSAVVVLLPASSLFAASASWNSSPTSNDWDDPANWTPQTVPQEETDIATFNASTVTNPVFSNWTAITLGEILFNPAASSYTIGGSRLALYGVGLVNNSGIPQTVDTDYGFEFFGSSRAGDNVSYSVYPNNYYGSFFFDDSSAGSATFTVAGRGDGLGGPGSLEFSDNSSAAGSTIINQADPLYGGDTGFGGYSTAGESNIVLETHSGVEFYDYALGGSATITADGGRVYFADYSNGGLASVILGNGSLLDISNHNTAAFMSLGPLIVDETSAIDLGGVTLTFLGPGYGTYPSNIAGVISGGGGILIAEGATVTLSGANTYLGGTTVIGGKLIVASKDGSATGGGPIAVVDGSLGGSGLISGNVTFGGGRPIQNGNLAPRIAEPLAMKIRGSLSFLNNSRYQWRVNASKTSGVEVAAKGITIQGSAYFSILGRGELPIGTVFTVLRNTGKTPIEGTFSFLPDGGTIVSGENTFEANYEGGDGNDLTLTVIANSQSIPARRRD